MKDQYASAQRAWRKQLNKVENLQTDSNEATPLLSERNLLETQMEILVKANERLDEALEADYEAKHVAQEKLELWEREHSDVFKRLNSRVTKLKQEKASTQSTTTKSTSFSRGSSHDSKSTKSSALERRVDSAAKVAKLKTELLFVDAEAKRTAALRKQEDKLRKFQLTKQLALAKGEMEAITKIEDGESTIDDRKEDVLPADVIDNKDLLNEYLIAQASSIANTSLSTKETHVEFSPELPEYDPKDKPKIETSFNPRFNQNLTQEAAKVFSVVAPRYSSALNPFSADYVTFSTPKNVSPTCAPESRSTEVVCGQIVNSSHHSSDDTLERLADKLSQKQARDLLPLPEPEVFRGDMTHFPIWQKSFDAIIERGTDNILQ